MGKKKLGAICEACHLVDPPSYSKSCTSYCNLVNEEPLRDSESFEKLVTTTTARKQANCYMPS